jgi:hypothetical protein
MASSYSPSLKIELIGNGDQSGTWGTTTNNNLGTILEQAITGVQTITMVNADYTLTSFNGVSDEARNAVLVATGTNSAIRQIICPLVEKLYIIYNNTTGGFAITIGGITGSVVTIPNGVTAQVYCDGTNFFSSQTGSAGNFNVNGALTVAGTTALTGALTATTAAFSGAISSVSPTFTGTPIAPTATAGTNTQQIATTAFVQTATGTFGTMATQNANAVAITGGTINGVTGTNAGLTVGTATNATTATTATTATSASSAASGSTLATTTAKAWVRYNGNSQTVLASYNVSSVTYVTTGTYTINFTTPMANTNYVMAGSAGGAGNLPASLGTQSLTTSSITVYCNQHNAGAVDREFVMAVIFST